MIKNKFKKIYMLVLLGMMMFCALLFVGCGGTPLQTPTSVQIDQDTIVMTWDEVPHATSYAIEFDNGSTKEIKTVRKNTYSLSSIAVGEYTIRVSAKPNNSEYRQSEWSSPVKFTREEEESGLYYKLKNGNREYTVSRVVASDDVVIPDTYRGKPVTSIADKAFQNSRVTSVIIGNNVKSIGVRAFANCTYLEKVVIPNNVQSIGEYAFMSCKALTSINIPSSISIIDDYTFTYCRALEHIDLPSSVTYIGSYAFSDCSALKDFSVPEKVQNIMEYTFSGCSMLEKVQLNNAIFIDEYAFYRCKVLKDITYSDEVYYFGDYAFAQCEELNNVVFPENLESVGVRCFEGCIKLDTIDINDSLTQIGGFAFADTKAWKETGEEEKYLLYLDNWLVGCTAPTDYMYGRLDVKSGTVGISDYVFFGFSGKSAAEPSFTYVKCPSSLKYIGNYSFYGCKYFSGIELHGVETIGIMAFSQCENLIKVEVGDQLKSIATYAFYGCKNFEKMELPDTVESIGYNAFLDSKLWTNASKKGDVIVYLGNWVIGVMGSGNREVIEDGTVGIADYCFNGTMFLKVTLPESLKYIGEGCFHSSFIFSIEVPSSVKEIKPYTFYNCQFLNEVTLNEGLEKIGRSAFYQTVSIDHITIPDSCKQLDTFSFYKSGMFTIDLGNGLETIADRAFYGAQYLTELTIPDSVVSIGDYAFRNCYSLENLTIGSGLKEIGPHAFSMNVSLKNVTISDGVEKVGKYAFYKCQSLENVTFGKDVTTIGDYAFYGCIRLKQLIIPANITRIDKYAFRSCNSLKSVILLGTIDEIGAYAFYGNNGNKIDIEKDEEGNEYYVFTGTGLTIFCVNEKEGENWNVRWNASYRPVIWGVTVSDDQTYVVSFVKDKAHLSNISSLSENDSTKVNVPVRAGYTFLGWATTADATVAEYKANDIAKVEDGTVLYSVWQEGEVTEEPETDETPDDVDGEADN